MAAWRTELLKGSLVLLRRLEGHAFGALVYRNCICFYTHRTDGVCERAQVLEGDAWLSSGSELHTEQESGSARGRMRGSRPSRWIAGELCGIPVSRASALQVRLVRRMRMAGLVDLAVGVVLAMQKRRGAWRRWAAGVVRARGARRLPYTGAVKLFVSAFSLKHFSRSECCS
jgi:hypothetical protein